jgi:hypothetical protein
MDLVNLFGSNTSHWLGEDGTTFCGENYAPKVHTIFSVPAQTWSSSMRTKVLSQRHVTQKPLNSIQSDET